MSSSNYPLYERVKEGTIEVHYLITKYTYENGSNLYDWIAEGESSDEWYISAEEAEDAVRTRYGA